MKRAVIFVAFFFLFLTAFPAQSNAVAGGHGGGSFGHGSSSRSGTSFGHSGGSSGYSAYPSRFRTYPSNHIGRRSPISSFFSGVLILGYIGFFLLHKRIMARQEARSAQKDFLASLPGNKLKKQALINEIEQTFITIQKAWNRDALAESKQCYTSKLYQKHLAVLNEQQTQGYTNRTEKVVLKELTNYRIISPESFSVQIYFSCIDYEEELATGRILSGSTRQKQYFLQTWYFDYDPLDHRWKADFIQPLSLS